MASLDDLYREKIDQIQPFSFDQKTAAAFDDMANRSIPFYRELQLFIAKLVNRYYQPGTMIYDLGCSTGNTILAISQVMDQPFQVIAVDKSPEMIELAKEKNKNLSNVTWLIQGIEDTYCEQASIINLAYVLQFVEPNQRGALISKFYQGLKKGGLLILSEKTCSDDEVLNKMMMDQYYQFKKDQGYTELEIKQKEVALKNSLIPLTVEKNEKLLRESGFSYWHPVFKFMNFMTWVVKK